MISEDLFNMSIEATVALDAQGILLKAAPGTPLEVLNNAAQAGDIEHANMQQPGFDYQPEAQYLSAVSAGFKEGEMNEDLHHEQLQTLAKQIAEHVRGHIDFARNTVRPLIIELANSFNEHFHAIPAVVEYHLDIQCKELPEPLTQTDLSDVVKRYSNVEYIKSTVFVPLAPASEQQIHELLYTGASHVDQAIDAWFVRIGMKYAVAVWNSLFSANRTERSIGELLADRKNAAEYALAAYLLTNKMIASTPQGVQMDLVKFNMAMNQVREQAALVMVYCLAQHERTLASSLLIDYYDQKCMIVNGEVYRKFIQDGGNNAMLYGSVLMERPLRLAPEILQAAPRLIELWERNNTLLTAAQRTNINRRLYELLENRLLYVVNTNADKAFGHLLAEGDNVIESAPYKEFLKNHTQYVYAVREEKFKDVWALATEVICGTVFPYSNAFEILKGIDEAASNDESLDINEATMLSLFNLVAQYVCAQIETT